MTGTWSGRAVTDARAYMARTLPTSCAKCGKTVKATDNWVVGHIKSRAVWPELTMVPSNWSVEHRACSDASAQSVVQEKAAADALKSHGIDRKSVFSRIEGSSQPPPGCDTVRTWCWPGLRRWST